ncbi:hypothetical protein Micbo1qcDRAFT_60153 [Microdochium bolleyi]|uniref:Uncharacterized protein n=1 Tax=Microdochium bolleyi TaxID=196109 RepID=A0A136J4W6_9PEZI|nr:hypothetical protein Micbo1qcDRAFT_60153 [Microdochium bolleyi]
MCSPSPSAPLGQGAHRGLPCQIPVLDSGHALRPRRHPGPPLPPPRSGPTLRVRISARPTTTRQQDTLAGAPRYSAFGLTMFCTLLICVPWTLLAYLTCHKLITGQGYRSSCRRCSIGARGPRADLKEPPALLDDASLQRTAVVSMPDVLRDEKSSPFATNEGTLA